MKTLEYKSNSNSNKFTVRTKAIVLTESRSCKMFHLQSKGANYNVYHVTAKQLEIIIEQNNEFVNKYGWSD
jgi:hypothetical protein